MLHDSEKLLSGSSSLGTESRLETEAGGGEVLFRCDRRLSEGSSTSRSSFVQPEQPQVRHPSLESRTRRWYRGTTQTQVLRLLLSLVLHFTQHY